MTLRDADVSDAARIAELTAQLGYGVDTTVAAERLSRFLARTDQRFRVAELDGRTVGWIHTAIEEYLETGAFVVVAGLVVDRDCRGCGVGAALINEAESWARSRGLSIVRLHSSVGRTAAHRFYDRLGYRNIKTQYSFIKILDGASDVAHEQFVPRISDNS